VTGGIVQPSASAKRTANVSASPFATGNAPGSPRQTGQTFRFGSVAPSAAQGQKSLLRVRSARWTSRPTTTSKPERRAGRGAPDMRESTPESGYTRGMIEVTLEDIAVSGDDGARFLVLLKAPDGTLLPIVIDAVQAVSIASARQAEPPPRPATHDLMLSMLTLLDARVARIEITDLIDGTFYALVIVERNGVPFDLDARPSDALALAARAACPIWVAPHVLEASGLSEDVGESSFEA
jgi:uncharacterized protein